MSLGELLGASLPGDRHPVTVDTTFHKLTRLCRELRAADHPLHPLAQQLHEDLANLFRRHLERPCPHWSGGVALPGADASEGLD